MNYVTQAWVTGFSPGEGTGRVRFESVHADRWQKKMPHVEPSERLPWKPSTAFLMKAEASHFRKKKGFWVPESQWHHRTLSRISSLIHSLSGAGKHKIANISIKLYRLYYLYLTIKLLLLLIIFIHPSSFIMAKSDFKVMVGHTMG